MGPRPPDAALQEGGAKYFVSMGSHHDNFFLWNSKLHRGTPSTWGRNATWSASGRRRPRNTACSLACPSTWAPASPGSRAATAPTRTGPKAGVPYDGADPKFQDLYHFPAEPGDRAGTATNPSWQQQWYNEIKELVDNYHPDLLYTDGGVPFGNEVGLSMIAHLYNSSAARNGGKAEVVYNCKQKSEGRWVEDLERGIMPKIDPYPWQTDTSIGDWFYNRNWKFRPVSWVIHMLVDNVSKNGNLLLNVVQRPDGSLDPEVEQMLEQLAEWNAVHGEAIFGTRPWLVYGESTVRPRAALQGGFPIQCEGNPLHDQGSHALRICARLARRSQAHDPFARQARRFGRQSHRSHLSSGVRWPARLAANRGRPDRCACRSKRCRNTRPR